MSCENSNHATMCRPDVFIEFDENEDVYIEKLKMKEETLERLFNGLRRVGPGTIRNRLSIFATAVATTPHRYRPVHSDFEDCI